MSETVDKWFNDTLASQIKQLVALRQEKSCPIYFQDYQLKSIFQTLDYCSKIFANKLRLKPTELQKLAEICTDVLDTRKSDQATSCLTEEGKRCELSALMILMIVSYKPASELFDRKILKVMYDSLVKKLLVPTEEKDELAQAIAMVQAGFSAYCLSRISLKRILLPEDASDMITDLVMPLAVRCLAEESKRTRPSLGDFLDNYHGLDEWEITKLSSQVPRCYSLLVRLLVALMRRSDDDPRGGRKRFAVMLNLAIKKDEKISDKELVALNVLVAGHFSEPQNPVKHLEKVLLGLLIKSEGLHRAHIAFLVYKCLENDRHLTSETKCTFAKVMIDDLVTKKDKLLLLIAINSIVALRDKIDDWSQLLAGKEIELIRSLADASVEPIAYIPFLKHFKRFSDSRSIAFDELTLRPISLTLDEIYELINQNARNLAGRLSLFRHLNLLGYFIKLRRHRLDKDQELRLNRAFELITKNEQLRIDLSPRDHFSLNFANSYQVYPSAWNAMLEATKYLVSYAVPMVYDPQELTDDDREVLECKKIVDLVIPHLLIIDPDLFYNKVGLREALELIYKYCKHAIDSFTKLPLGIPRTLLPAILLTWPKDHTNTKLDSNEHRMMLNRFIELLVNSLESAKKDTGMELSTSRNEQKIGELLSALVAAFSVHREVLHGVLEKHKKGNSSKMRDSWLRENISRWIRFIVNNEQNQSVDPIVLMFSGRRPGIDHLSEFALVSVAHEGFKVISRDSHPYAEHKESLLKAIKAALERGLDRAPVNSIESKRYKQMQATL